MSDNLEEKKLDYLCIGHSCHDKVDDGYILGGTVSYAATVAAKMGSKVGLITSVGPDFLFHNHFKERGIEVCNKESGSTTEFENIYKAENRIQYMHSRASTIYGADIPAFTHMPDIVHIGTIADEVDFDVCTLFNGSLIGASIQGSMRQWDEMGKVSPNKMDWEKLKNTDVVFISDDDILGMEEELPFIISHSQILVLTMGSQGVKVYSEGQEYFYPSYPSQVKDPTGAGDTFATAFLLKYAETKDIEMASIFAHCAASIVIENMGLHSIPSKAEVEKRILKY